PAWPPAPCPTRWDSRSMSMAGFWCSACEGAGKPWRQARRRATKTEGVQPMKLASYLHQEKPSWGLVVGGGIVDMGRRLLEFADLRAVLAASTLDRVAAAGRGATPDFSPGEVTFLPPIPQPDKILCFGNNYREHVLEAGL